MSRDDAKVTASRRQSVGYMVSFAAMMVAIVCLAVAVQGTRRILQGIDGLGAFNQAGVPALLFAMALNYYSRLSFWNKISAATQSKVRVSLRIIFGLTIIAAIAGTWFVFSTNAASGDLVGILIVGDLLQIGTLLWIWRYSKE